MKVRRRHLTTSRLGFSTQLPQQAEDPWEVGQRDHDAPAESAVLRFEEGEDIRCPLEQQCALSEVQAGSAIQTLQVNFGNWISWVPRPAKTKD